MHGTNLMYVNVMGRLLGSTVLDQRVKQKVKAKVIGKDEKYKSTS